MTSRSHAHPELDPVVGREDHWAAEAADKLGNQALVHPREALLLHHLEEAVDSTPVEPLVRGLLRVQHHAPPHRVERVVEWRGDRARHGGGNERGDHTEWSLVSLVGIHVLDLREETKLPTAVDESTSDRDGRTPVKASDAALLGRLHDAIRNAVELPLSLRDVRSEASAREVEWIAHNVGQPTSATPRQQLHAKVLPVMCLYVV